MLLPPDARGCPLSPGRHLFIPRPMHEKHKKLQNHHGVAQDAFSGSDAQRLPCRLAAACIGAWQPRMCHGLPLLQRAARIRAGYPHSARTRSASCSTFPGMPAVPGPTRTIRGMNLDNCSTCAVGSVRRGGWIAGGRGQPSSGPV